MAVHAAAISVTVKGMSKKNRRPSIEKTHLDGVGVAVAALAEVGRGQGDAGLDRLGLAREVAQVELGVGEQVLAAAARRVLDALWNARPAEAAHAVHLFHNNNNNNNNIADY